MTAGWLLRDRLASALRGPAVQLFGVTVPHPPEPDEEWSRWSAVRRAGGIQLVEVALWCAAGAVAALAGWRWGKRAGVVVPMVYGFRIPASVSSAGAGSWVIFDYDVWCGDLWTVSVLVGHAESFAVSDSFASVEPGGLCGGGGVVVVGRRWAGQTRDVRHR